MRKRIPKDTPRIVNVGCNMTGSGGIHPSLSAKYAGSGRETLADKAYGLMNTWAMLRDEESLKADGLYCKVLSELQRTPRLSKTEPLEFFRGRTFETNTPTRYEMGPPPEIAEAGRYNEKGQSVLYCSLTQNGVWQELKDRKGQIWVQAFSVSTKDFNIADFSQLTQSEYLLNNLFWFAELAGVDGYPGQLFSRFVAKLVETKFNAMLLPGVRGDQTINYMNLVFFKPGLWRDWLKGSPCQASPSSPPPPGGQV